jgi:hypothetical protein
MRKITLTHVILFYLISISNLAFGQSEKIELYPPHEAPADMSYLEEALHRRAIEVAVWATPLMNYEAMYRSLVEEVGMKMNDVVYHSRMQNWKRALPTPSDVTPYGNFFWDLSDGPVVIEIPPTSPGGIAMFGTLMDSWHRPLVDYGTSPGEDGGRGAKYIVVGPGYRGALPSHGYHVIYQKYNLGWTLTRVFIKDKSEESFRQAVAQFKKIKIYPYAERKNPPAISYIDLADKEIDGIVKYVPSYFERLHAILGMDVIEEKDKAMLGMLKAMSIDFNEPYTTTARRDVIFADALKDTHEYMVSRYHGSVMIPPYYEGKRWGPIVPGNFFTHRFEWNYPSYLDYERRGAFYYAVFSSVKVYGPGNFFLDVALDQDGKWLDGSNSYKLHVPSNVPVTNFWALTAYDIKTAAFIRKVSHHGIGSTSPGLITNKDGTVDLYIGPKAPTGKQSNWIPTQPGQKFFMLFRFYGNLPAVFTKEWQLNDVIKQ